MVTPMFRPGTHRPRRASGQTLLELMLATSLTALAVVPALQLLRTGMDLGQEIETRQILTTFCVSKVEEHLASAGAGWVEATATGNFSSEGYAGMRFQAVRSDDVAAGGIVDRLMVVTATVWEDSDADTQLDASELQVSFMSKVAKMDNYQNDTP